MKDGLCLWAENQQVDETIAIDIDAICGPDVLRIPDANILAQGLSDLAPYGKGNPSPLIQVDNVTIQNIRPMGEKHIRMNIMDIEAVWWNGRVHSHALTQGPVSIVGSLGYNNWRGRRNIRFTISDAKPFTETAAPESSPGL
jgi:single-stranded-DNA-specific exonuclease